MDPQVGNLNVGGVEVKAFGVPYQGVLLRKPKFKPPVVDKDEKNKEAAQRDYKEQAELAGAYLITPDALLPFECPVKDDYGLTSIGYNYKVRRADVELMSQGGGGAKVAGMQIDQAAHRANAILVANNFQFLLRSPLAPNAELGGIGLAHLDKAKETFPILLGGQKYLDLTIAVLKEELRRNQGYREAYVSCDGFNRLLERESGRMIFLDVFTKALADPKERAKLLTGSRSSRPWEFDFKEDDGFDVRKHLPELKAVDVEKTGQQHYYLQIAVQAVDNNIETGKHLDDKGQIQPGNKKTNRNGFIGFLVISENELLTQISLEEETLAEKLEGAKEKVDAGIVNLRDQMGKVADPKTDMDNVLNRMNEIRTALGSAGNTLRNANKAYENILREMEVNRVRSDRMKKIGDRIAAPLKDIVVQDRIDDPKNPQTGSYPNAEDAFQNAQQLVEDDVNAKRAPNYAAHRDAMNEADRKLRKLSLDIKHVLDAMSEGIVEAKLIAILTAIEDQQRQRTKWLDDKRNEIIRDELEKLLKDADPKSPPKKEESKQEKKQASQLRTRLPVVARCPCPEFPVGPGFPAWPEHQAAHRPGWKAWPHERHPAVLVAPHVLSCQLAPPSPAKCSPAYGGYS